MALNRQKLVHMTLGRLESGFGSKIAAWWPTRTKTYPADISPRVLDETSNDQPVRVENRPPLELGVDSRRMVLVGGVIYEDLPVGNSCPNQIDHRRT